MKFLFPAERSDPCEELNAWRFQRCQYCGWTGDISIRKQYKIDRLPLGGFIVDSHYYESLRAWFVALELC